MFGLCPLGTAVDIMLMFLPHFGDDSEHRSRFFLKYHHKTPHVYGHESPDKYFEENS